MNDPLRATLIRKTHHSGLILASEDSLAEELDLTNRKLRQQVAALVRAREIEVLAPLPFLVVRALSWSSRPRGQSRKPQQTNPRTPGAHMKVPVSGKAAAATQPEDGGVGEGGELLDEVLAVLGAKADRQEFTRVLAGHSATLIQRALARVQATQRIRVSKAALFRSLLQKLSG